MKNFILVIIVCLFILVGCKTDQNIDTSVYMDSTCPVGERVEALLSQMTLEEKIGQMDMVCEWDMDSIFKGDYRHFGAWIAGQEPEEANKLQALSEQTRLKIP